MTRHAFDDSKLPGFGAASLLMSRGGFLKKPGAASTKNHLIEA
jgi:hypothetical protein